MAVLTFPGAEAVLAAQAATLAQPDQLCGPFVAHAALHAVLDPTEVPTLLDLAVASGSAIWPHDVPAWRPAGAQSNPVGWDRLPAAMDPEESGTDAAGLADGIAGTTDASVAVVPVAGRGADADALSDLLVAIATAGMATGVVANVRTGALDPGPNGHDRDVGHFVALWAVDLSGPDGARVAVADTYRELGAPGEPVGCRWVPVARLADAMGAAPGRGLLLLVRAEDEATVAGLVTTAGLEPTLWST